MRIPMISLILALSACATPHTAAAPTPEAPQVTAVIQNSGASAVKVYQVIGTTTTRLDVIPQGQAKKFVLHPRPDNQYTFYLVPFASNGGTVFGPIPAVAGDEISLTMQDYLPSSMFMIRRH